MVDKTSLKDMKRKKIVNAQKAIELVEAETEVPEEEYVLTGKEERELEDLAENDSELTELRESAMKAKKQVAATKRAKQKVNKVVPAKDLTERPGYGHITGSIKLHSYEAYRFILGREKQIKTIDGKRERKARIVGVLQAGSNVKKIVNGFHAGCPYATWTLVQIEEQIQEIRSQLKETQKEAEILRKYAASITIDPFTSKGPKELKLEFNATYAFHFADLLAAFDNMMRPLLNYKIHGFIEYDQYKSIDKQISTPLRRLFRLTDNWFFVGKEAVEQKNAKLQDAEYRMGILPEEIISGEKLPKLVRMKEGFDDENE